MKNIKDLEEIPFGFVATEFIRPLARMAYGDDSVDSGLLEGLAQSTLNYVDTQYPTEELTMS